MKERQDQANIFKVFFFFIPSYQIENKLQRRRAGAGRTVQKLLRCFRQEMMTVSNRRQEVIRSRITFFEGRAKRIC